MLPRNNQLQIQNKSLIIINIQYRIHPSMPQSTSYNSQSVIIQDRSNTSNLLRIFMIINMIIIFVFPQMIKILFRQSIEDRVTECDGLRLNQVENSNINTFEEIILLNRQFTEIFGQIGNDYHLHDERIYRKASKLLQQVIKLSSIPVTELEQTVLPIGKTGWGKSTAACYLDGVQLIGTSTGLLEPTNQSTIKTAIGDGMGSTTLLPIYFRSQFGNFYDLPGDQETRGFVPQIINSLIKKSLAKAIKNIKLLLVVPASVFTSQGSYGSQFKIILNSADKLLGGINKYQDSILMIVTFARRSANEPANVIKNIKSCLDHSDQALHQYRSLIEHVIQKDRVKLMAEPDHEQNIYYSAPTHQEWSNHHKDKIVESIISLKSHPTTNINFSVPYSLQTKQKLSQFIKIFIEKAKNQLQTSFSSVNISGIELTFVQNQLKLIRNSKNLGLTKFARIFTTNRYIKLRENFDTIAKQIQFIYQFMSSHQNDNTEQNGFQHNWVSQRLDQKLTKTIQQIIKIKQQNKLNFRKGISNNQPGSLVNLKFNSIKSKQISQTIDQLQLLYQKLQQLQQDKINNQSPYYDNVAVQVYDKTVMQPYQIQQNYVEIEKQQKIHKVQKQITEQVPITKTRVAYRTQTQNYVQKVAKVRSVPRQRQQTIRHCSSSRRYIVAGPRDCWNQVITHTYHVDQVYYVDQPRTRSVQVASNEPYQQMVSQNRIIQVDQLTTVDVPVQKTRMVTLQKQVKLYKDEIHRVFNQQRYQLTKNNIETQMKQRESQVKSVINAALKQMQKVVGQDKIVVSIGHKCRTAFQCSYKEIFGDWFVLEYEALKEAKNYYVNLGIQDNGILFVD